MWLFTRYGFYSIACAQGADGSIDTATVMIRARVKMHLQKLQERFAELAGLEIRYLPERDYGYRIIAPKETWVQVLGEVAREQSWSNFKNEVARHQGDAGSKYVRALHEVWHVMYGLQKAPAANR